MTSRWSKGARALGLTACLAMTLAACGGGDIETPSTQDTSPAGDGGETTGGEAASCGGDGELNMAVNPWTGYVANAYVVGVLAEQELGCKVNYKDLQEDVSWQGFGTGEVDVIIEDWGHPALEKQYFEAEGDGSARDGGLTGNVGIIGWYVPPWLAEEHPEVLDYSNLNDFADQFKTGESGGQGQFLGADPSYVQFDEAIVSNLDLNFKVVFSGSEAATLSAFEKAEENKEFLIGYMWEPISFMAKIPLQKVALPPYTEGCQDVPAEVACDYPETPLKKIIGSEWADAGGGVVDLVDKFSWTNDDQNAVASYISDDKMEPADAAKKWIADNPDKVAAWLGS